MREIATSRTRNEARRRLLGISLCLVVYAALTAGLYRTLASRGGGAAPPAAIQVTTAARPPVRNIALRDGRFYVDGEPFLVQAVGWDPTRPGELPWRRTLAPAEIDDDLARIRAAGFNTLRTWAPLGAEELAVATRHGLRVLQGIWVPPDGPFDDPTFRRRMLKEVSRHVEASRWSPAVLGYLVLNEPRAKAVARVGLDAARAFLREVVATVRALDPSAPIGYASWPGMEALDDDLLDFVAFNVYPHRPRVVMDEFGLLGYVRMLQRTVARGRPLLISEYGVSVSPGLPLRTPGRGGASEEEQARQLCDLTSTFLAAGAAGTAVFQWNDGWWKNNEQAGDEATQDPHDPEEWFGLIKFANRKDRRGAPRPALTALTAYQRAVLVEPRDGQVAPEVMPVRIFTREPVRLRVRVDGKAPVPVPLASEGAAWATASLPMPREGTRHDLEFELSDARGTVLRREHRLLRREPAGQTALALLPARLVVRPGQSFPVELRATGERPGGVSVSVASFTEDRYNEQRMSVRTGAAGRVKVALRAPEEETLLTIMAFEDDPQVPPPERAAAWAVVEVRGAP